ncbi:molybdopterin-dependent oxidoreductase [Streptomyces sp. NPDC058335]|uniref:molybdopterin-dependent oxidoreductase n=1 Tax=Streptomyces sp. NPDC058335 TaxID=3346451 RepID=UPI00365DD7A6
MRLTVNGRVRRPLSPSMEDLRACPAVTTRVTTECAGNGRAPLSPRPVSRPPRLVEAVGTAEWTGVALRLLLEEAGAEADAVGVMFTEADHGLERGVEQDHLRGLSLRAALGEGPEVLVAHSMNGRPLPPSTAAPCGS